MNTDAVKESINIEEQEKIFQEEFEENLNEGLLSKYCTMLKNITTSGAGCNLLSSIDFQLKDTLPPRDQTYYRKALSTLKPYHCNDLLPQNIDDDRELFKEELRDSAKRHTDAVNRFIDWLLPKAVKAGLEASDSAGHTISKDGNNGLTPKQFLKARKLLSKISKIRSNSSTENDWVMAIDSETNEQLINLALSNDTNTNTNDYTFGKAVMYRVIATGNIESLFGFKIKVVPDLNKKEDDSSQAENSSKVFAYAWYAPCVGLAIECDKEDRERLIKTSVYHGQEQGYSTIATETDIHCGAFTNNGMGTIRIECG